MDKDEIILIVKKAISANISFSCADDEGVILESNDVDHTAEEVAEKLYNAGYRKFPEYAVILTPEEREEEIKSTNEILAERDGLKAEIERLKAENKRLSEKLGQVLLSIDTVKEMNTMCDIDEQRKQAVEEFAERLKDLLYTVYGKHGAPLGDLTAEDIAREIDELLKEYEK